MRKIHINSICKILVLLLTFSMVFQIFEYKTDAVEKRFQIAYDFEGSDPGSDFEGKYDILPSSKIVVIDGKDGGKASETRLNLKNGIFKKNTSSTVAFWVKFDNLSDVATKTIFYAGQEDGEKPSLEITLNNNDKTVSAVLSDGKNNNTLKVSVADYINDSASDWVHFAVSYETADSSQSKKFAFYINGTPVGIEDTSAKMASFAPSVTYFSDFKLDNIYITNVYLSADKIKQLFSSNLLEFVAVEKSEWKDPDDADDPDYEEPTVPPDDDFIPVKDFTWLAYTFDSSMNFAQDLNHSHNANLSLAYMTAINTANYDGGTGIGLARRKGIIPNYYLKLDNGLLYDGKSFSFSAWVYRQGSAVDCTSTLFEFSGDNGKVVFSPFSTASNTFEYSGPNGVSGSKKIDSSPSSVIGNWVHYALTFDTSGNVVIYVNGKAVNTFSTGIDISSLKLKSLKIVSNNAAGEDGRVIIDDIYMSSKVLQDFDVRKLWYYGVSRYVSEVLPDPDPSAGNLGGSTDDPQVDLMPDGTDELEDNFSEYASINGYIGTTFDDSMIIGRDYNNTVTATIRNASLTEGFVKYGLLLNGTSSYLRYPSEILDAADELTISLSYKWSGPSSGKRTQKLFDFSAKPSSVGTPTAYIYLDMGDGNSGMSFCISDGSNSTVLETGKNLKNEWARVSVTIKDKTIKLYVNSEKVAESKTDVNLFSVNPNYCFIGKSGVKGDPLFSGIVDEIYISKQAVAETEIKRLSSEGILPVENKNSDNPYIDNNIWDNILTGFLIVTLCLVVILIGIIVFLIVRRQRRKNMLKKKNNLLQNEPKKTLPKKKTEEKEKTSAK